MRLEAAALRFSAVLLLSAFLPVMDAAEPTTAAAAAAALHDLRTFATTGRVLHIAAHPDDENTQLIAYLSRGRGYDTAYLSVTRGDGGQNVLGPQFDEELGVARTQELLAARRIDGGRQYFTRAIDFGFSKNPEETLAIWGHKEVLGDVVRVIRRFRPDVIVSRFPPPPGSGGHGHHTASAILAVEAFKAAGDPKSYPEQLAQGLSPWQPRRILWNGFSRGGEPGGSGALKMDISGTDPVTGESFGAIAGRSRAMHKTQGFGEFSGRGGAGPRVETFVLLAGEPAVNDIMDGIDTSWNRVPGGAEIGRLAAEAVAQFDPAKPEASVPVLLSIRRQLAALKPDTIVAEKRARLDEVLQHCLGLEVSSRAGMPTVVPGEMVPVLATVRSSSTVPLTWLGIEAPGLNTPVNSAISEGGTLTRNVMYPVAAKKAVTQPHWLRVPGTVGLSGVSDPKLIGEPENPPDLPLSYRFEIDGQSLTVHDTLSSNGNGLSGAGGVVTPVAIVPPVTLRLFPEGPAVFQPGATKQIRVQAVAARPNVQGTIELDVPSGWRASAAQPFRIERQHAIADLIFDVTAPKAAATASLGVRARVGGEEWMYDGTTVKYPHIPRQLLQPPARKKLLSVKVQARPASIGYIAGAGDDIPDALRELGFRVETLEGEVTLPMLASCDAVVVGVRAFNTRNDSAQLVPVLNSFVEKGGTVIAQYNWARNLKTNSFAPYPLRLSNLRVTDENAEVTLLAPDHPVLNKPNRITADDFKGWIQERGVYFADEWDERFVPILAMSDPGEEPLKGGLLIARHGKGHFVYTGLAFFRQLPAGVPGAYRLFANLVSLGR